MKQKKKTFTKSQQKSLDYKDFDDNFKVLQRKKDFFLLTSNEMQQGINIKKKNAKLNIST